MISIDPFIVNSQFSGIMKREGLGYHLDITFEDKNDIKYRLTSDANNFHETLRNVFRGARGKIYKENHVIGAVLIDLRDGKLLWNILTHVG